MVRWISRCYSRHLFSRFSTNLVYREAEYSDPSAESLKVVSDETNIRKGQRILTTLQYTDSLTISKDSIWSDHIVLRALDSNFSCEWTSRSPIRLLVSPPFRCHRALSERIVINTFEIRNMLVELYEYTANTVAFIWYLYQSDEDSSNPI